MKALHSNRVRVLAAALFVAAAQSWVGSAQAQLLSSWTAPPVDDGTSINDFVGAWKTDVTTGRIDNLPELSGARALAADNVQRRIYASSGGSLSTFTLDATGELVRVGAGPVRIRDANGVAAESYQVSSMGFANGVIYASVARSAGDEKRRRGIAKGFYAIDWATAVATLIPAATNLPQFAGMDFNPKDGRLYAVIGASNAQSIVSVDLSTFSYTVVVGLPASAYAFNQGGFSFDGVAVGDNKVFLTNGLWTARVPIVVFDLTTLSFGPSLQTAVRTGENGSYPNGATFFAPVGP